MTNREKKQVSVLLTQELYVTLHERAIASKRSTAGYIRLILKRYVACLERQGDKRDPWLNID